MYKSAGGGNDLQLYDELNYWYAASFCGGMENDMKRLISFLLSLSMAAVSTVSVNAAKFSDTEDSQVVDVVTGLGLMEGYTDGTFLPESNITRAEFAEIIAKVYTYGAEDDAVAEWKKNFFDGVYEDETALIPPEEMNKETSDIYSDVLEGSDSYDAIKLVTRRGIMKGIGGGEFLPDGNLSVEQALKVIVTMMGYAKSAEAQGGYPSGYLAVAADLRLTDNVSGTSSYATRMDLAQIFYNALDVPVMQWGIASDGTPYYDTYQDDTFLTKILDLDHTKGRMTSDGYTTLSGEAKTGKNKIVVNNVSYTINDGAEYVRDYLGRDVEVYYSLDEDRDDFVYAHLTGRDESVKIDISEFERYSGGQFTYLPADAKREKNIQTVNAPFVVKNGSALPGADDTLFDFNYGTVEVITPAKESKADLFIVRSCHNFNIELVDKAKEVIYSRASLLGNTIDLNTDEKDIFIYDSAGNVTSIDSLASGVVTTVYYGEKKIEIYISDKTESKFYVRAVGLNDDNEYEITGEKEKYVLSKDFCDMNPGTLPKIGSVYNLKIDILGNIVDFKEAAGEITAAFMNDVRIVEGEDGADERVRVKYFDMTTKTVNTVYLADKVKIMAADDTTKTYSTESAINTVTDVIYDAICTMINNVKTKTGSMFRYKMNEEGEITWIELPGMQENSLDDSSRLVEIKTSSNVANNTMYNGSNLYGGTVIINSNTKILQCNYASDKFGEDSGYEIITNRSFKEGGKYDIKAYSTVKNSPVAEFAIYTSDPTKSISTEAPQTCAVVEKIYTALDENDEVKNYMVLDSGEYAVDSDVMEKGNVVNMQGASSYKDANGVSHDFEVGKGDIIRYALDTEGVISQIQLVYDANADYSDGITIGGKLYDGWSKRGNLAGCIAGYDREIYSFSNPFSASSSASGNSFSEDSYAWTYYNGNMRVMLGSVVRTGSGYIITTTRNLAENPGIVDMEGDGYYTTNLWNMSTFKLVTVSKKSVEVSTENIDALKTYAAVGKDCDRVFITTRLGNVYNAIVYRYDD